MAVTSSLVPSQSPSATCGRGERCTAAWGVSQRPSSRSCRPAPDSPSTPAVSSTSPGRAPLRRLMQLSVARPMAVTLTVTPPSEAVVSPPMSATPNSSESERYPSMNSSAHAPAASAGSAMERSVATGRPPMAAMSLRLTASDLAPSSRADIVRRRKCTPSVSRSAVKSSDSPPPSGSTAQSSPMPSNPLSGSEPKRSRMWSMNPNSVMSAGVLRRADTCVASRGAVALSRDEACMPPKPRAKVSKIIEYCCIFVRRMAPPQRGAAASTTR